MSGERYQELSVGIVGCGEIMQCAHLPIYSRLGMRIRQVFDPDPRNSQAVLKRFPQAHAAKSYQDLISEPELDFIDIAIPPQRQTEVALAAIHAGKHVLCQKPLASNIADARRIVQAARDAQVYLVVNHQMRWAPFIRQSAATLRRGEFGDLVYGRVNFLRHGSIPPAHWISEQPRLTCLFNTIHVIDSLRFLFGEPSTASGLVRRDPQYAIAGDTTVEIWLQWPTGAVISITDRLSMRQRHTNTDILLEGDRGTVFGRVGLWDRYPAPSPDTVWYQPPGASEPTLLCADQCWIPDAFAGPISELAEAILHRGLPTIDGVNALRNLEIVEAVYASSESGRSVGIGAAPSGSSDTHAGPMGSAPRGAA